MAAFLQAGAWLDMVQIGNEITGSLLWVDGRIVDGDFGNPGDLLKGCASTPSANPITPNGTAPWR